MQKQWHDSKFIKNKSNACNNIPGSGSVAVDLLFIVAPIVCGGFVFGPCLVI